MDSLASSTPGWTSDNVSKHVLNSGPPHLPNEVYSLRQAILASYLATFVFGIAGNGLVIYIIAYYKAVRIKSVANYYIWNLSFADLFLILTLPFFCYATYYQDWPFGWFVCKMSNAIRETNRFASVFTLVALSMDRYIASFYNMGHWRTIRTGKLVCVTVWMLCLAISTPYWIYSHPAAIPGNRTSCRFTWPSENRTLYVEMWTYFQVIFALAVPSVLIFGSYILLSRRLKALLRHNTCRQSSRIQKPSKKMTRMVLVVVFTFLLCQTPYHIVQFLSLRKIKMIDSLKATGHSQPYIPSETEYRVFVTLNGLAQILAFVSSCCNPIIYGLLNDNYRKLYSVVLCRWCVAGSGAIPGNIDCDHTSRVNHLHRPHTLLESKRAELHVDSDGKCPHVELERRVPLLSNGDTCVKNKDAARHESGVNGQDIGAGHV